MESAEDSFLELEVRKVTYYPSAAQMYMDVTCSDVKLTQAHIRRLSGKSLNLVYFQRPESANTAKDAILFGVGSKVNVEEGDIDRVGLRHRVDQLTMKLVISADLVRKYDAAVPKPGSHLQIFPGVSISQLHRVHSGLQSLKWLPESLRLPGLSPSRILMTDDTNPDMGVSRTEMRDQIDKRTFEYLDNAHHEVLDPSQQIGLSKFIMNTRKL